MGLLALLISFWAIYECGCVDNDWVASQYESHPMLTDTFRKKIATPPLQPWIWAAALLIGVFLLNEPAELRLREHLAVSRLAVPAQRLFHGARADWSTSVIGAWRPRHCTLGAVLRLSNWQKGLAGDTGLPYAAAVL